MDYLLNRSGRFYYNRRVPENVREYDARKFVRIALKTESRKEAARLALSQNEQIEAYWKALIATCSKHSESQFQDAVSRARLLGFSYQPVNLLAQAPLEQIVERLQYVKNQQFNSKHVEAVLGGVEAPKIKIDDALLRFWDLAKDKVLNKSPNQIRKWQHPRRRAIKNFLSVVGNKALADLTREDTLKFRDWWIERIKKEDLVSNSANKDFIHVKVIIETVNENLKLGIDTGHIFKKLLLTENDERRRLPFETDYIRSTLLNPDNLKGLNDQARWVLHVIAETGVGLTEQVGLTAEDIVLDGEIPHIVIAPKAKNLLKTKYRKRTVPLVGYAWDAFRACPNGFTEYKDRPDLLSSVLGKYLHENNLLPTDRHTVNSLRHSFQDRLLAVNAPDRVQADLMGHKFSRQLYGNGADLMQKQDWLLKIVLKN